MSQRFQSQDGTGVIVNIPNDGVILSNDGTNGTRLCTATTQKLAFYGATPIVQRTNAAQVALTDNSGGTASDTLPAISATYVQAEVRNSVASLAAKVDEIRTTLVNMGLMKGS